MKATDRWGFAKADAQCAGPKAFSASPSCRPSRPVRARGDQEQGRRRKVGLGGTTPPEVALPSLETGASSQAARQEVGPARGGRREKPEGAGGSKDTGLQGGQRGPRGRLVCKGGRFFVQEMRWGGLPLLSRGNRSQPSEGASWCAALRTENAASTANNTETLWKHLDKTEAAHLKKYKQNRGH